MIWKRRNSRVPLIYTIECPTADATLPGSSTMLAWRVCSDGEGGGLN